MDKNKELRTAKDLVEEILRKDRFARNSDDYLYIKVCEAINADYINVPFYIAMSKRKEYGIPAYESVRRTRQHLQAEFPELEGSNEVEYQRLLNEGIFRDFAVRKVIR